MNDISPIIAEIRDRFRAAGISLAEFSRRSNVGSSRILEYFNGKRRGMSLEIAERLARALGCELQLSEKTHAEAADANPSSPSRDLGSARNADR